MQTNTSYPLGEGGRGSCFSGGEEADAQACKRLCNALGAPWYHIDLSAVYESEVLDYFRQEYLSGRTPNPCLRCNPVLKFGLLPAALKERGIEFDYYATGHYVRLFQNSENICYIGSALDNPKDQSYFLQRLPSQVLKTIVFPLGGMSKQKVRQMAKERGLEAADKPDSQDFAAREDLPLIFGGQGGAEGNFVLEDGLGERRIIGRHRGLEYYTIGQRRGLGLSLDSKPCM